MPSACKVATQQARGNTCITCQNSCHVLENISAHTAFNLISCKWRVVRGSSGNYWHKERCILHTEFQSLGQTEESPQKEHFCSVPEA